MYVPLPHVVRGFSLCHEDAVVQGVGEVNGKHCPQIKAYPTHKWRQPDGGKVGQRVPLVVLMSQLQHQNFCRCSYQNRWVLCSVDADACTKEVYCHFFIFFSDRWRFLFSVLLPRRCHGSRVVSCPRVCFVRIDCEWLLGCRHARSAVSSQHNLQAPPPPRARVRGADVVGELGALLPVRVSVVCSALVLYVVPALGGSRLVLVGAFKSNE